MIANLVFEFLLMYMIVW